MAVTRRMARSVLFGLCLSGLSLTVSRGASKNALTLGVVVNQEDFQDGGCALLLSSDSADAFSSERYIFMSDYNGRAAMNINGHDTKLTLLRTTESRTQPKKGDRSTYWYASGPTTVEVDYTVTGVCPPDDESCEVSYFHAMIHVTSGSLGKSVAAHGLCGV
jgi:hypothetical protein